MHLQATNPRAPQAKLLPQNARNLALHLKSRRVGKLQQAGAALKGAWHFAKLYLHPVKKHELPAQIRVAPVW